MVPVNAKKRGAILVFVLGLVVLLGVLCLRLMEETVQELRHVSQYHKRDDLRLHAYSLLDITVAVLHEFRTLDGQSLKTGGGWGNPLHWSGLKPMDATVKWSVSLKGESGKLPLFSTPPKVMKEIFAIMHEGENSLIDEDDGQVFYDTMMDWQDADDNEREEGAEDDFYEDMSPSYFTPGKNIQSFEEFRMIRGFGFDVDDPGEDGLFFDKFGNETLNMKNFRESFSFYHEGKLNICETSSFLRKYICGDDDQLFEEISAWNPYSGGMPHLKNLPIPISMGINETFAVEILVKKGKALFKLHAALTFAEPIAKPGSKNKQVKRSAQNLRLQYTPRILRLRENEIFVD